MPGKEGSKKYIFTPALKLTFHICLLSKHWAGSSQLFAQMNKMVTCFPFSSSSLCVYSLGEKLRGEKGSLKS